MPSLVYYRFAKCGLLFLRHKHPAFLFKSQTIRRHVEQCRVYQRVLSTTNLKSLPLHQNVDQRVSRLPKLEISNNIIMHRYHHHYFYVILWETLRACAQ